MRKRGGDTMTVAEVTNIFLNKYPEYVIDCAMDSGDGIILVVSFKDKKSVRLLDNFFKVSNDGAISGYSPMLDQAEFKKARSNTLYTRKNEAPLQM